MEWSFLLRSSSLSSPVNIRHTGKMRDNKVANFFEKSEFPRHLLGEKPVFQLLGNQ
jgi:hypothetical protein